MKNTSKSSKLLSLIMAFLILLVSLPTYALASSVPEDTSQGINEEPIEETSFAQGELVVLEEDISLREENVKHFKLSNGTVKAVSYANPVHYLDADGNWIDIDNSLTLNGSEYTANNKQEIKFANKSGSNGLLSIKDGEYKIDFTPLNTNKVSVEIENPQENNSRKFDDVKKLNNTVSKATYKGIYEGIDLEYILVGNNIKENIIVNKKQEEYTYSFEIKLSKLNATLENNMVILTDSDTGEKVYEIPAPYMVDANGEYSDKVEYTLTKDSKWKYTFTVKADPEWINEEERQLPVKIDPTVLVNTVAGNISDTFIMDEYDYSAFDYMIVGNFIDFYYDVPGFIKFEGWPTVPENHILVDAKLSLYINYVERLNDVNLTLGVFEATSDEWETNPTASMSEARDWHTTESTDVIPITTEKEYVWNITPLYEKWTKDADTNNGLCIKAVNLPQAHSANVRIKTAEHTEDFLRPKLEITYTDIIGVEDYYAYAENTLGDVGKSYVNLYNGSLTYINHLTSVEVGPNLTYDIDMVYNSIEKVWTPSFNESITMIDYNTYDNEPVNDMRDDVYYWRDTDGTSHAFTIYMEKNYWGEYIPYNIETGNLTQTWNPQKIFYPEDDIDYVLIKTENDEYILRDYQGNQKMFDSQGRLSKICDAQGNAIHINNYLGENNIASIYTKDSNGDIVFLTELFYFNDGRLVRINDNQNQKEIRFSWCNGVVNYISYYNYGETTNYKNINFGYDENKTNLEYVLDGSINQKIKHYIDTKDDEDASNDEKIIEIVNINGTQEQKIKKYIVGDGFYRDLGPDFTANTNDDFLNTFTFDEKGRKNVENHTYDDELMPKPIYFNISYSQNIYNKGFNIVKHNMKTGENEFISFAFPNIVQSNEQIDTTEITPTCERVDNSDVINDPYKKVCQILAYYSNTSVPYCSTGFLCGSNLVMMSGHALGINSTLNNIRDFTFPNKIEIIPGQYVDEEGNVQEPFGKYEVSSCYIQREYYYLVNEENSESYKFDWAVCMLNVNEGEELEHFNVTITPSNVSEQYIEILGYPENTKKMYTSTGVITNLSEERIYYNATTYRGNSGSPIFLNNGNYIVCGIHTSSAPGGTKINSLIYSLVEYLNE